MRMPDVGASDLHLVDQANVIVKFADDIRM